MAGRDSGRVDDDAGRSDARRDFDRIFYTSYFNRLAGVSQVLSPHHEVGTFHNRLTHSLKVAQVARSIAERLLDEHPDAKDEIDPDVAAAAGLAHDLGHPAFGHVGEEVLSEKSIDWGIQPFEGNPQSFRVVTRLAVKAKSSHERGGLQLCPRTLRAIIKYPWRYSAEPEHGFVRKFGAYDVDEAAFRYAYEGGAPGIGSIEKYPGYAASAGERSVEAQIMDLADDISYAIHDCQDFLRFGVIAIEDITSPRSSLKTEVIEQLTKDLAGQVDLSKTITDRVDLAIEELRGLFEVVADGRRGSTGPVRGFSVYDEKLFDGLVSALLARYCGSVRYDPSGPPDRRITINPEYLVEIAVLKRLTWFHVINTPEVQIAQLGQRAVVEVLCDSILSMTKERLARSPSNLALPTGVHRALELAATPKWEQDEVIARAVVDYVGSLTDRQASQLFEMVTGHAVHPVTSNSGGF